MMFPSPAVTMVISVKIVNDAKASRIMFAIPVDIVLEMEPVPALEIVNVFQASLENRVKIVVKIISLWVKKKVKSMKKL